ncbi:MAG: phage tail protein [Candidatus Peregrinibacteria bacterium]|nr:phage tail protein [Candidatus Peregrinibacteria bacterium]
MNSFTHTSPGWRLLAAAAGFTVLLPVIIAASPAPAADVSKQKLFLPSNFRVEIDGVIVGGFKEVSGVESEVEVIEEQDAGLATLHKRPGKVKYGNIILKRGFVNDPAREDALREWYKKVLAGTTDRKSISIIYLDRAGNEVMRYNLFEAWPCRWKAPELNSKGDTTATESIDFCVEKVERI